MIREFNDLHQLAELRDDWRRLLAVTPQATFFQSLEWLEAYWKHFGGDQRLKVMAVYRGGEVEGIVPLVVRREKTKIGTLRYLTWPLDYWGSFYGAVGAEPYRLLAEALAHLQAGPRKWDLLELRWIGSHADDCRLTTEALQAAGRSPVRQLLDQTAVIRLPESWEAYLASRTSKWRNNLKRWQRKTAELGDITYLRYRPAGGADGDPRFDLFECCVEIAQSSWQADSPDGTTLSHASIGAFVREAHRAAAAVGCLDLNLMLLDGKPVAFGYNYVYQGRVFGLRVGYHPSVKASGAGNVLYARMIEDSCRRGDRSFDLGPGSLDCKRQIWTDVLPIYRLSCYQRFSLGQQLMRLKHQWNARGERELAVATS